MAVEWRERSLGELTENLDSVRVPVKEADRRAGPYPYYGASGIVDYVANYLFEGEYLLIAEDGENLRTRNTPVAFLARGKFWVNNHAHIVRGNREADTRFLMYALAGTDISGYLTGSTMPKLTQGNMNRIPILAPPVDEQRAIAHILGTLDDKIELNRRMNDTLEAIARALFKSWFVEFDPVRAKSEGRSPGLPPHLADLFPDSFVDSELGEIPKGWGADSVYRIAHVLYGAPFKSNLFNERREGRPLIRIRDLGTHDPEVFTPEEHPRGYLVQPGDLVVGMDGEFRAHLWRGPEAWLNQRLCCFKPAATVPRAFVHYSIESLLDFFERSKTGTTVIHLGKADIDTFCVLIPSGPVLRAFASLVDAVDSRVVATAQESRVLAAMRDELLPGLMSGELGAASIGGVEGRPTHDS